MAKVTFNGVPSGGVNELRNYLVYLVDELTYLLENIDSDNLTDDLREKIEKEDD